MAHWLDRELALIGRENMDAIYGSCVAVVGLGGVGGAAFEALVRAGVGRIIAVDCDTVDVTNLNRQILATADTVGIKKTEAAVLRARSINPDCEVIALDARIGRDNASLITDLSPDWVIDAVDSVTAKLAIIKDCREKGIGIVSCMGTGNRVAVGGFVFLTAAETAGSGCPLARVMRRELRKLGLDDTTVLCNTAPAVQIGTRTPASISYGPPVAGYMLAGYVICNLMPDIPD